MTTARRDKTSGKSAPVALVTGATGILGPTLCRRLKASGFTVAASASSRDSFKQYRLAYREDVPADAHISADLTDPHAPKKLLKQVHRKLGPVTLLVNNAVMNCVQPIEKLTPELMNRLFQIDFAAPISLLRESLDGLIENKGSVVNITSVMIEHYHPGNMMYSSLKLALERATEHLAVELGPRGVRVNAIRLGSIAGDIYLREAMKKLPAATAKRMHKECMIRHRAAGGVFTVTGEAGAPDDVADMLLFLASPAARFVTGAVLPLDGGMALMNDPLSRRDLSSATILNDWLAKEGIKL